MNYFKAVKDIVPDTDDKIYTLRWVEDWRGDEVRSRLAIRQYNGGEKRWDLFQGAPDTWMMRLQIYT